MALLLNNIRAANKNRFRRENDFIFMISVTDQFIYPANIIRYAELFNPFSVILSPKKSSESSIGSNGIKFCIIKFREQWKLLLS